MTCPKRTFRLFRVVGSLNDSVVAAEARQKRRRPKGFRVGDSLELKNFEQRTENFLWMVAEYPFSLCLPVNDQSKLFRRYFFSSFSLCSKKCCFVGSNINASLFLVRPQNEVECTQVPAKLCCTAAVCTC